MPNTVTTSELLARVKAAGQDDLKTIASELRSRIIDVVSKRGGHLAPSLGVVELTLALHHVFDSPRDAFVWDVGHQAYAHKIITGRDGAFDTLRTKGGVSGFPKRSESPHDPFGAGHSSTSISAALGIAEARRMSGEPGRTVAIIGDGSMTAGLAFEGLNHAGHLQNKNLIVILNDNQMSIDKNVGALARFMNKGITSPTYNRIRRDMRLLLSLISTEEMNLVELTRRAALVVKDFFLAGSLFEALGFRYFGPVDGHDLATLVPTMKSISNIVEAEGEKAAPILLHVITKKGKGYGPAERDPSRFHGIGPFDIESGNSEGSDPAPTPKGDGSLFKKGPVPTYTQVFGESLCDLMEADARVIAVTAAMPTGTGLDIARERFPGRYFDVGIAEPHAVCFAAGMASRGFRPVVAIYSSFLQRAYDQVVHDVCLQRLPVVFAIDRAGVVGEDGPTHHGLFDISYLRHIPNLTVMAPKDENELRAMLISAVNYQGPVAIRYPRGKGVGVEVEVDPRPIPIGRSTLVFPCCGPEGRGNPDSPIPNPESRIPSPESRVPIYDSRFTIFALGNMVSVAVGAARLLAEQGVSASVINARFVKPLDEAAVAEQLRLGCRIVTIEDGALAGGFGSSVLEFVNSLPRPETRDPRPETRDPRSESRIPSPDSRFTIHDSRTSDHRSPVAGHGIHGSLNGAPKILRLGYPDAFIEAGKVGELHAQYGLTAESVAASILAFARSAPADLNAETLDKASSPSADAVVECHTLSS